MTKHDVPRNIQKEAESFEYKELVKSAICRAGLADVESALNTIKPGIGETWNIHHKWNILNKAFCNYAIAKAEGAITRKDIDEYRKIAQRSTSKRAYLDRDWRPNRQRSVIMDYIQAAKMDKNLKNGTRRMGVNTISRLKVRTMRKKCGHGVIAWNINRGDICNIAPRRPLNGTIDAITPVLYYKAMDEIRDAIIEYRGGPFDMEKKFKQIVRITDLITAAGGEMLIWA